MKNEVENTKMKRNEQATVAQRIEILNAVIREPKIVTRKLDNSFTFQTYSYLWEKLHKKLNGLGPSKDVKAWQKYLTDQKARVKKKAAEGVTKIRKTGGGEYDAPTLTDLEEKFLAAIGGRILVEGDDNVPEFGVACNNRTKKDNLDVTVEENQIEEYWVGLDETQNVLDNIEVQLPRQRTCVWAETIKNDFGVETLPSTSSTLIRTPLKNVQNRITTQTHLPQKTQSLCKSTLSIINEKENESTKESPTTLSQTNPSPTVSDRKIPPTAGSKTFKIRDRKRRTTQEDVTKHSDYLERQTIALENIAAALQQRSTIESERNTILTNFLNNFIKK